MTTTATPTTAAATAQPMFRDPRLDPRPGDVLTSPCPDRRRYTYTVVSADALTVTLRWQLSGDITKKDRAEWTSWVGDDRVEFLAPPHAAAAQPAQPMLALPSPSGPPATTIDAPGSCYRIIGTDVVSADPRNDNLTVFTHEKIERMLAALPGAREATARRIAEEQERLGVYAAWEDALRAEQQRRLPPPRDAAHDPQPGDVWQINPPGRRTYTLRVLERALLGTTDVVTYQLSRHGDTLDPAPAAITVDRFHYRVNNYATLVLPPVKA